MKSILFLTTVLFLVLICVEFSAAQSTSQDFPTPIISNEIAGLINPRDIGDSRLTTYFYTFNGDQGDLFINIVTKNFTGDLDIFTTAGLRPVTKIVIYANDSENETGRAVYFRKTEKLLLRIQGRTPNDDPASFRIKFAGSFGAVKESDVAPEPELPKVNTGSESGVRVNSVGTILPTPRPLANKTAAAIDNADNRRNDDKDLDAVAKGDQPKTDAEKPSKRLAIVVTDNMPKKDDTTATTPPRPTRASRRRRPPAKMDAPKPPASEVTAASENLEMPPVKKTEPRRADKRPKEAKVTTPDPLASIRLVIAFKDGKTLEKSMSEVFKFSVDRGILTVILKDGSISRYPIVDVAKITIE